MKDDVTSLIYCKQLKLNFQTQNSTNLEQLNLQSRVIHHYAMYLI